MLSEVRELYRRSRKPKDLLWNTYAARPAAAFFLHFVRRSRVTPNQITFLSLAVFVAGAGLLAGLPGQLGVLVAALVMEASYVLDCMDGQLARLRGTSTPVGAHLDFLMDELKAFLLVPASAVHLHLEQLRGERGVLPAGVLPAWLEASWLYVGLAGVVIVASAISLTTFTRRPEYTGDKTVPHAETPEPPRATSPLRRLIGLAEAGGRFVIHYPSYLLVVAALDAVDVFLLVYVAFNALYGARTFLGVLLNLARVPG